MPEEFHCAQWAATAFSNEFLNRNARLQDYFLIVGFRKTCEDRGDARKKEPGQRNPGSLSQCPHLVRQVCIVNEVLRLVEVQATSTQRTIGAAGIRFRHGPLNIPYPQLGSDMGVDD